MAESLIEDLGLVGIDVPSQAMVLGASCSASSATLRIPMTSVYLSFYALGTARASQAHRLLSGTRPDPVSVPTFGVIERASTVPQSDVTDRIVNRALRRIAREDRVIPSVTALARHCRVHRNVLLAHFRKELDQTPEEWLRERAMQRAVRLLVGTDQPAAKIAKQCGITSTACR